jgi:heat shock protein HslJ
MSSSKVTRMTRALLILVAALLAVSAADAGSTQSSPLTGKVWVTTTVLGNAPLPGTQLTAEFTAAGDLTGSAGCNRFGGTFTTFGQSLRVSALSTTQMACAPKIMAQETAYLKALVGSRSYAVSGARLTLRNAAGRAVLTYTVESQALAGTSWNVTAYNNAKQAVVSVAAGSKLTAVFGKDGSLTGFAGCNDYDAPYQATPPKLSIGTVASTRKECATPKGVMTQELQYLTALHTAARYRIEGNTLELRTASGALAAEFERR